MRENAERRPNSHHLPIVIFDFCSAKMATITTCCRKDVPATVCLRSGKTSVSFLTRLRAHTKTRSGQNTGDGVGQHSARSKAHQILFFFSVVCVTLFADETAPKQVLNFQSLKEAAVHLHLSLIS